MYVFSLINVLPSSGVHSAVALCDGSGMVGLEQVKSGLALWPYLFIQVSLML